MKTFGFHPVAIIVIALVVFWLQLLGHEAAHDIGRDLFAGNADLTARWPRRVQIAYFAGGPLFTLLLVVAAAVASRARAPRLQLIAACVGVCAGSRLVWVGVAAALDLQHDERTVSRFLTIPPGLLQLGEFLIAVVALAAVIRALPATTRRDTVLCIGIGAAAGWVSAIAFGNALGIPVM